MGIGIFLAPVDIQLINSIIKGEVIDTNLNKEDIRKIKINDNIVDDGKIHSGWLSDTNFTEIPDGPCMLCHRHLDESKKKFVQPRKYEFLSYYDDNKAKKYTMFVQGTGRFCSTDCTYTHTLMSPWLSADDKEKIIPIIKLVHGRITDKPLRKTADPALLKINGGTMEDSEWYSDYALEFKLSPEVVFLPANVLFTIKQ